MTHPDRDGAHSNPSVRNIERDFEYHIAHGQNPKEALSQEIHKLRQADSHHGKLDKSQFHRDLHTIEHDLKAKHLLPSLQIDTHGRHAGDTDSTGDAYKRSGQRGSVPAPEQEQQHVVPTVSGRGDSARHVQSGPDGHTDSLKTAVERAKAGGRPLTITQIGDSHIAFGTETPAIAARLAADFGLKPSQIRFSSVGDVGKTASYAKDHPGEFMKNVHKNTDLVIVSFGSNEATKQEGAQYGQDYAKLIGQIKERDPGAAIAMVGPTDGNFWNSPKHLPGLASVTREQESVAAHEPNSSYFDVAPRMGSVQSMRAQGLMLSDNLHLTPAGYKKLGAIIADGIARSM